MCPRGRPKKPAAERVRSTHIRVSPEFMRTMRDEALRDGQSIRAITDRMLADYKQFRRMR